MIELVAYGLGAMTCVMLASLLGRRTRIAPAVLLVVAGLVYALLPAPDLELDPEVILVLILPPLLYSAALNSSLLAIRSSLRTVVALSVFLVLVTAVAVGWGLTLVVAGLPLGAAIALGAAVAPPDPVGALAVGRRAGLPPRLITLIEGEGLLNDATAITAFGVAVAAAVSGEFSWIRASGEFLYSAAGGIVIGLGVAWAIRTIRLRLDDPIVENALSLATPFLVYLPAEKAHVAGILAVVVAGLWLGHQRPRLLSGASRLQTRAVWRLTEFVLEGFVFLLIGNQLPTVIRGIAAYSPATITAAAAVSAASVLLVRPLWLFLVIHLPGRLSRGSGTGPLSARETVAVSWVGIRGIFSLAAVFALPLTTASGEPFPFRDLLIFCAYIVVLVTLVGQGLTFAPLLRSLHIQSERDDALRMLAEARTAATDAALRRLDEMVAAEPVPEEVVERLRIFVEGLRQRSQDRLEEESEGETVSAVTRRLRHEMIEAEREELLRWRDAGRLPDAELRAVERELDHEEGLLNA